MNGIVSKSLNLLSSSVDLDSIRGKLAASGGGLSVLSPAAFVAGYERWRHHLMSGATEKDLPRAQWMRPDYTSYAEYGTVVHWPLLLYINNIKSIEEYTVAKVLVPSRSAVGKVADLELADIPVNRVDRPESSWTLPALAEKAMAGGQSTAAAAELSTVGSYVSETLTVDTAGVLSCGMKLAAAPNPSSFILGCSTLVRRPIRGVDYALKKVDGSWWVKWGAADVAVGRGMSSYVLAGTVLEAQYITYS